VGPSIRRRRLAAGSGAPLLAALLLAPGAQAADASWRVVQGSVRVVCPLTIGGSFEARTEALTGTVTLAPAARVFDGELAVDLTTLETGISLRNEHLRQKYLEVGHGPEFARAVLSEIRVGDGDPRAVQGHTRFSGTFLLHGTRRPIAGEATVRREGHTVRVEAGFPVTLPDFGIAKPRYLGVGVKDRVQVTASLVAEASAAEEPAAEDSAVQGDTK
jgi:polyisoprenoid-binding protein YceI